MDYKFAIRCWQDQAGDENAKANVFVDGTQVATEVEVTATSDGSPSYIMWESTGIDASATTTDIKVVLTNEYYVDSDTDRNIHINGIGFLRKGMDATGAETDSYAYDGSDYDQYVAVIPTAVVGDQIPSDLWSSRETDSFYTIIVWGGDDSGVTISTPLPA